MVMSLLNILTIKWRMSHTPFPQLSNWSQECTLWGKRWRTSEEQINKVAGDAIYSVLDYI